MRVIDVYRLVTRSGMSIKTDGERVITIYPGDRLTDELRALIRANKVGLIELLTAAHQTAAWLVAGLQQIDGGKTTGHIHQRETSKKVDS